LQLLGWPASAGPFLRTAGALVAHCIVREFCTHLARLLCTRCLCLIRKRTMRWMHFLLLSNCAGPAFFDARIFVEDVNVPAVDMATAWYAR
jgi:hypothetical protein